MPRKKSSWKQVTTIHSFKDSRLVRVFGICRVSTDKQAQKVGESLDHQKEVLQNWVRSKSSLHMPQQWKLIDVFVENEDSNGKRRGKSATRREGRFGLSKALELARLKLIDVLVVTKLDRIARNVKDYIDISAELNENGVALVCLDLDIDASSPDGALVMRQHASLAQWQAERIAQYSIETVKRHVAQGRPIGPPPLGYKKARDKNSWNTFKLDSVFRKHVLFMDKLYLRVQSVNKVVDALHKKGYKTPKNHTYSKPQVSRILQNIRYTGRQEYDGKVYSGNWKPLRTVEVQETINRIFEKNRKTNHSPSRTGNKYVYLAQSILKCGGCGSSMVARPATGRSGKYYGYYMCQKAYKTHGHDCEMIHLSAEAIDDALIQILRNLKLKPDVVTKIVQGANVSTASTIQILEKDLGRVQESLKVVRSKTANLVEILAEQGMKKLDALKKKLETLTIEEEDLVKEEDRLRQEIAVENVQAGTAKELIQTLDLFNDFYEMNKDKPERIKVLILRVVNAVVCEITDKKKGIGKLKIGLFGRPFDRDGNAEVWNEVLQKIADECYNNKALKTIGKIAAKPNKRVSCNNNSVVKTCSTKKFAQGKSSDPSFR